MRSSYRKRSCFQKLVNPIYASVCTRKYVLFQVFASWYYAICPEIRKNKSRRLARPLPSSPLSHFCFVVASSRFSAVMAKDRQTDRARERNGCVAKLNFLLFVVLMRLGCHGKCKKMPEKNQKKIENFKKVKYHTIGRNNRVIFYLSRYDERSRDYQSCCCCYRCDIFLKFPFFGRFLK